MVSSLRRILEPKPISDAEIASFQRFIETLAANPSVQIIGVEPMGRYIDLWIKLGDDNESNEFAIYDAVQQCRADGVELLIDLHVVFADEPERAYPVGVTVLYRRW